MDNLPREIVEKIIDYRYGDKTYHKIKFKNTLNELSYYVKLWCVNELINHPNFVYGDNIKIKANNLNDCELFINRQITPDDIIDTINCNEYEMD